jgi:hypothetical protein
MMRNTFISSLILIIILTLICGCINRSEDTELYDKKIGYPKNGDIDFQIFLLRVSFPIDIDLIQVNLTLSNISNSTQRIEDLAFNHSYNWYIHSENGTVYSPEVKHVPYIEWPDAIEIVPGGTRSVVADLHLKWFVPFGPNNNNYLPSGNYSLVMDYHMSYSEGPSMYHLLVQSNVVSFRVL